MAGSLWAKITFSNDQYTNFFFRTTGKEPYKQHSITKSSPALTHSFPSWNCRHIWAQPLPPQPPPQFHQHQTSEGQYHSKPHTCAQIKISPLTFPVHQTQLTLEASFQSPLPALTARATDPVRGEQKESLLSRGRKVGGKEWTPPLGSYRHLLKTVRGGDSAPIRRSSPGPLGSLDHVYLKTWSSVEDGEIRKETQVKNKTRQYINATFIWGPLICWWSFPR